MVAALLNCERFETVYVALDFLQSQLSLRWRYWGIHLEQDRLPFRHFLVHLNLEFQRQSGFQVF